MAKISSTNVMRSEANVKLAQDFIERNKGKTVDELKVIAKNSKMSSSEKRQLLDYLEKNSTRELNKSLSYGDINNSEKLMGAIYDNTPTKQKANRKDVLALSNTKYTNALLEKILQTQNDTAMSENILKYQQQVVSNLTLIQADIKQLVDFAKPKEVGETQAERKELEMGVSSMAKAMSNLDFREFSKEFGKGLFKQFDTDGTGELLGSMLGMFKEQIQEGSFATTIKDMIKESILDRLPMGSEIKRWRDDPVGFSQEMINRLGMSDNAGLRSLFKSHIKGMKPNLTPQIKKIDMSAVAQFDNKVHTAITRIIPEQLYKMVALLSGKEERRFDWEHQTYRNVSNMMADEYNKTATKSLTYQVDNQMRDMGANIEEIAATNKDIKNMLKFDKNGKIIKDENTGMPVLKNRGAVRQVISNIISSGCTLPDLMYGEPIIVIRQWRLDAGFSQNELGVCLDAVKFLKVYYSSLPKADKESAIEDFKSAKQELNDQEVSELVQSLDEDQRMYYQSILNNKNLTEKEMKQMFKNINIRGARVDVGPLSGFFGGVEANRGSSQSLSAEEILDILRAHKDDRNSMSELSEAIVNATGRTLTDKDKDDRSKFMNKLASGTDLDKAVTASDTHDGTNEFRTYASTNREKWDRLERYLDRSTRETIDKGIGISDENSLTNIKESILHNKSLNEAQQKTFDKYLNKLNRAFSLYEAYDNAGLTANATARLLGVSPSSVKNKLRGPEDLMEFISDDGKIDVNKLKAFTASSGVDLSYITDEANERVEKDYQKSQRGSIGGGLKNSITQTLSSIFGDPKIANKAGIAVGSAAGLGIAQLLKNEGIITSPRAQYLLAAVGGGLMSMERTRKYMQNIFGPEGDIKNEQGVTNKEIFFAKAMQKYLPTIGVGGAAFKFVNKAMASFGPLGKVVGFPLALVTAGTVGAAAPHMVRALQRSLFDRDKDDQSWMAKLGRFLKDVPFIKKYFDVTGIQSPGQIRLRSLESVKANIQAELAGYQGQPLGNLTPEQRARMTNLKDKLTQIDKLQAEIQKSIDDGVDGNDEVGADQDEAIQDLINKINKDYAVNSDGTLNMSSVTSDKTVDYGSIQQTSYDRIKHANDLKMNAKNGGENVADMNYSNHFTGNTADLAAGINSVSNARMYSTTQIGNGVITRDANQWSVRELYEFDEDSQRKILAKLRTSRYNEDKEFVKKFELYKRLKDAGVNVDDSSEAGLTFDEHVRNEFANFLEKNQDAENMLNEVAADENDTIQSVLQNEELVKELLAIKHISSPERRKKAFDKWKESVGEEKLKDISELTVDNAAKDVIIQKLHDITKDYVELTNYGRTGNNKLQGDQIEQRVMQMMSRAYTVDMLTGVLKNKFSSNAGKIATRIKTFLEPGNEAEEMSKHKELMDIYNEMAGGKGSKSNTRVKMSELSDKKFKTGERLSIAGCSVAALNNALYYMGITTVDVDTLVTIANNHLTQDGGVSSDFFQEVGEKLGVKVTLYNNRDNKFTPESLLEVKPGGDKGLIILLKNKDGNGFHYVTARNINTKNVTVDDPELNNSNTKLSTGDICVRAQELIVLKKFGETKALKESPVASNLSKVKSVVTKGRDLLGSIKKDGILGTAKNIGKGLLDKHVINPLLNSTVPMTNMSVGDLINGGKNATTNVGDIVRGILDGLKDMTLNFRMVEDMTLPLKMNDPEAARAVANTQGMNTKDDASKNANQMSKKLISNKDVSNAMNEADDAEDALMTLASLQNDGMVAGESTGAGGKGSNANAPHQSGPLSSIMGMITGALGTKGMKFLPSVMKAVGLAGLGATMWTGYNKVGKPLFRLAKDQLKRGLANLPIFGSREEEEYQYDENGQVISGQHKDSMGAFRNIRDAANLTKVGLGSVGAGVKALEKIAKLSNSSIKVVAKVGNYADDMLKNKGWVGKALVGIGKISNWAIKWMNKLGLGKVGFTAGAGKAIVDSMKGKIMTFLEKFLPRLVQAGAKKGAEGFLKKLPLLGSAIALVQCGWSAWDAYKHSEAYTGVDPSKLEFTDKLKIALAKALYDAGIELILSLLNVFPGAGTAAQIGWSVLRATGVVRLDDFFTMFGVGRKELRAKVAGEDKKTEDAEKKVDKDLEADESKTKKEDLEKDKKESGGTTTSDSKMKSEYENLKASVGEETANKQFEEKYGKEWQSKLNNTSANTSTPNTSSNTNHNAAVDYTNSQSEAARGVFESFAAKQTEKLSPEDLQELTKNLEKNEDYKLWSAKGAGWEHPLKNKNAKVTSAFGPRNVVGGSSNHKGIDMSGTKNTPVFAMKDGEVIQNSTSYGIIKLKHDDGTMSRYVHMSQRFPKVGDRVKSGEQIGFVGGIGVNGVQQYGDHLHFEVFNKKGDRQDPFLALGLDPGVFKLGPHGRENEAYLRRHAWLLAKSQSEADKLLASETANKNNNKPEKIDTNTKKGDDQRDKRTSADLVPPKDISNNNIKRKEIEELNRSTMINMFNENSKAMQMLSAKFDQMIQLLSQIASATGQISNNSMSDFSAPSVIR